MNTLLLAIVATAIAGARLDATTVAFTALVALIAAVGTAAIAVAWVRGKRELAEIQRAVALERHKVTRTAAVCDRCWLDSAKLPCTCSSDCGEPECYGYFRDVERDMLWERS